MTGYEVDRENLNQFFDDAMVELVTKCLNLNVSKIENEYSKLQVLSSFMKIKQDDLLYFLNNRKNELDTKFFEMVQNIEEWVHQKFQQADLLNQ